jgi:hypothetical protein
MYSLDEYTNGIQPCDKKSRQLDENTTSFINILSKNAFDARFWSDLHLTKRVKSITLVMELFHVSFSIIKIGNVSNYGAAVECRLNRYFLGNNAFAAPVPHKNIFY